MNHSRKRPTRRGGYYLFNPMLRWCVLNTSAKSANRSGVDTIQPEKTSKSKRIDGLVSLLNAFVCYTNHED